MRDVNGKEIRVGQRARWIYSEPVEGIVESLDSDKMAIQTDDGVVLRWLTFEPHNKRTQQITVEVLAEPRIPEPKGLGAVVEAGYGTSRRRRRFTLADNVVRTDLRWWGSDDGWVLWDNLIDPILLSEGWTDGE